MSLTSIAGGGISWTGQTTCVSGYYCFHQNPWYFQCIPGTASTSAAPASSSKVATTTTSVQATSTTSVKATSTTTPPATSTTASGGGGSTTTAAVVGNPFSGVQLYANPYYSSEIYTLAIPSLTASLAVKASAVAKVGTFVWL
jgi:cellulose 1,4-beta-cellobiosidase